MKLDDIADRMLQWALGDDAVRALWVEGELLSDVRRPYAVLDLHLAADEPQFQDLLERLPGVLRERLSAEVLSWSEAPRFARLLELRTEEARWTLIVEKTSLLGKRARAHVAALLDRTGHLAHVMDFSRRSP